MTIEPGVLITVAGMAVGGIVWLVRLEGRINLADSRHSDIKETLDEIKQDVRRIRAFMGGVDRV